MNNPYIQDQLTDRALVRQQGECEALEFSKSRISLQLTSSETSDQLGIYQIELQPRTVGAQLHYHRFMDETFVVNQGKLTLLHGEQTNVVSPGGLAHLPRFTPHGFRNDTDEPVLVTLIFNPAMQREGFFRGIQLALESDPPDAEAIYAIYTKYDSFPIDAENMTPLTANPAPK